MPARRIGPQYRRGQDGCLHWEGNWHRGRPWWHKDQGRGGHGTPAYRYWWQDRHRPLPVRSGLTRLCESADCISEHHWVIKAPKALVRKHVPDAPRGALARAVAALKDPANRKIRWRPPWKQDRVAIHQLAETLGMHPLVVYAAFAQLSQAARDIGELPPDTEPQPNPPPVPRETKPPEPDLPVGLEPDLEHLR